MDRMTRIRPALLIAVVTLIACSDSISPEQVALSRSEILWQHQNVRDYALSQRVACFCGYGATTYQVIVRGDTISQVVNPLTGAVLPASERARFRTVTQLFSEVREAMKVPGKLLAVEYDPRFGLPTLVSLDPIKNAVDDEVAYYSGDFGAVGRGESSTR